METQLSVQLGIDSLLNDFGLENVMKQQECNAKEYNAKEYIGNEEKVLTFFSSFWVSFLFTFMFYLDFMRAF